MTVLLFIMLGVAIGHTLHHHEHFGWNRLMWFDVAIIACLVVMTVAAWMGENR